MFWVDCSISHSESHGALHLSLALPDDADESFALGSDSLMAALDDKVDLEYESLAFFEDDGLVLSL